MWTVYLLECRDGTYYTGIAKDVEKRLAAHNAGRGARYTRTRGPVRLLYTEPAQTCGDALKRELQIKRLPRERKARLAEKNA